MSCDIHIFSAQIQYGKCRNLNIEFRIRTRGQFLIENGKLKIKEGVAGDDGGYGAHCAPLRKRSNEECFGGVFMLIGGVWVTYC